MMIDRQLAYCRRVIVRSRKVKVCKNQLLAVVNMIRDTEYIPTWQRCTQYMDLDPIG